jgi:hypothetical protein
MHICTLRYTLPVLAVVDTYWRVVTVLCFLAAHNSDTIGAILWRDYPLMQMVIHQAITALVTPHVDGNVRTGITATTHSHPLRWRHLGRQSVRLSPRATLRSVRLRSTR